MVKSLKRWIKSLNKLEIPIKEEEDKKLILNALNLHSKNPADYEFEPLSKTMTQDSNVLLKGGVSKERMDLINNSVQEYNSFRSHSLTILHRVIDSLNHTQVTNGVFFKLLHSEAIFVQPSSNANYGFDCLFTNVRQPSNEMIKFVYKENEQWIQSDWHSVSPIYSKLLQAMYTILLFPTAALKSMKDKNGDEVYQRLENCQYAIQFLWEFFKSTGASDVV